MALWGKSTNPTAPINKKEFSLKIYIKEGEEINRITNSLNRHGHIIVKGNSREIVIDKLNKLEKDILSSLEIKK